MKESPSSSWWERGSSQVGRIEPLLGFITVPHRCAERQEFRLAEGAGRSRRRSKPSSVKNRPAPAAADRGDANQGCLERSINASAAWAVDPSGHLSI